MRHEAVALSQRTESPALRHLLGIALAALAILLAADFATLLRAAALIVGYPYGLDYGEGIVWQQMIDIAAGRGYAPLGVYPAIVYHYPPVYHLSVASLSALFGADPLATGRSVSIGALLVTALLTGALARRLVRTSGSARAAGLCGMFAGLIFLSCQPVTEWAMFMRVDMLACVLSVGGLACAVRAVERPRLLAPAAICFVLAVFTKQVAVAAPAAAILGLLIVRPARGLRLLAACTALGGAALLVAELATGGGFLRHIVVYNINRTELARLTYLGEVLRGHLVYMLLAALGGNLAWRRLRSGNDDARRLTLLMLLIYLAIKTLMLAMIMKSGSSPSYLIEWCVPLAIFAALGLAPAVARVVERRSDGFSPLIALTLIVLTVAQAMPLGQWRDFSAEAHARAARLDRLSAAIRRTARPVIADDMTLLLRAGKPVTWEPAIVAELASVGRYDELAFVALVRRRCFGGFITEGDRGNPVFDARYNPPVAGALADGYPRERRFAGLTLHLPPAGAAPADCFAR